MLHAVHQKSALDPRCGAVRHSVGFGTATGKQRAAFDRGFDPAGGLLLGSYLSNHHQGIVVNLKAMCS
jgi:hypothetical protein